MHRIFRSMLPTLGALLVAASSTAQAQFTAYGVTTTSQGVQQLVRFNTAMPGSVITLGPTGARLTGIDFRPATGELFGYAQGQLYTVNVTTGAASFVFNVGTASGNVGFDFNPVVDRIRVVDAAGTNLRLNQLTGTTTTDVPYTFAAGDVNEGRMPSFTAVAYTNAIPAAPSTMLFGIDATLGQLVRISNPNGGTVNTVGSLGIGAFGSVLGFDIVTVGDVNTAFFTASGTSGAQSQLYRVNLGTGAASSVGTIGAPTALEGLAITPVPEPGTWALMAAGLVAVGVARRRGRRQG